MNGEKKRIRLDDLDIPAKEKMEINQALTDSHIFRPIRLTNFCDTPVVGYDPDNELRAKRTRDIQDRIMAKQRELMTYAPGTPEYDRCSKEMDALNGERMRLAHSLSHVTPIPRFTTNMIDKDGTYLVKSTERRKKPVIRHKMIRIEHSPRWSG